MSRWIGLSVLPSLLLALWPTNIFASDSPNEIVIAVMDTGFDKNRYPSLNDYIWKNPGEISGNRQDDDDNGYRDDTRAPDFFFGTSNNQHGTLVMREMQKLIEKHRKPGDLPIKFMPMRIMGPPTSNRKNLHQDFHSAIDYAFENGAEVVNVSLNIGRPEKHTQDLISTFHERNIILVGGAGNNSSPSPTYPASLGEFISVASVTPEGQKVQKSNFGPAVDISAVHPYTSYAAAKVSATAALIKSRYPDWTPQEIEQVIFESVDPIQTDLLLGTGILNTERALSSSRPNFQLISEVIVIKDSQLRYEAGSPFEIEISRRGTTVGELRLPYRTIGLGAEPNIDFIPHDDVLVWNDGDRTNKVIVIEMINDKICEPMEGLQIQFDEPVGGDFVGKRTLTNYISDVTENDRNKKPIAHLTLPLSVPFVYGDAKVGFPDFLVLSAAFGTKPGDTKWNSDADIDKDGEVAFPDFVRLAYSYGTRYGDEKWSGDADLNRDLKPFIPFNAITSEDPEGHLARAIIRTPQGDVLYDEPDLIGLFELQEGVHELELLVQDQCNNLSDPFPFVASVDQEKVYFTAPQQSLAVAFVAEKKKEPPVSKVQALVRPSQNQHGSFLCALSQPEFVSIQIYDQLGRPVRHLVNENMPSGHHYPTWDGRGDDGSLMASGMYIVKVKVASQTYTEKFVLIR